MRPKEDVCLPSSGTKENNNNGERKRIFFWCVLIFGFFNHDAMHREQQNSSGTCPAQWLQHRTLTTRGALFEPETAVHRPTSVFPPAPSETAALLAAELFCFTGFTTTGFCLCAVHKSPASGLAPFQVLTSAVPKKVARD